MRNNLIYIRQQLRNRTCDEQVIAKLHEVLECSLKLNNIFTKVCELAINNALKYISQNRLESAEYQINLIHNLPFSTAELEKWNENHFYEFELPVYFENTDDAIVIKKMIVCLGKLTETLLKQKNI